MRSDSTANETLSLCIRGVFAKDAMVAKSMLPLCQKWLKLDWTYGTPDSSDLIIVVRKDGMSASVICLNKLADIHLNCIFEIPLRIRPLLDALLNAETMYLTSRGMATGPHSMDAVSGNACELPDLLLQQINSHPDSEWAVTCNGQLWFYVSPENGVANIVDSGRNAATGLELDPSAIYDVTDEFDATRVATKPHDCENWWWELSFLLTALDARPPRYQDGAVYHLNHWPDFGRLNHHTMHVRVASFLRHGWLTMGEVKQLTHASHWQINNFITAMMLNSSLDQDAREDHSPPIFQPEKTRLIPTVFTKIRERFSL